MLPPGAVSIARPLPVTGEYALWVSGDPLDKSLEIPSDEEAIDLTTAEPTGNVLAIETYAHHTEAGLCCAGHESPVARRGLTGCVRGRDLGFGYYSGRVLYKKTVAIDDRPKKVWLDLGDVRHYVEVYVNGALAGTLLWPPYELEITDHLTAGDNEIALVVTNSIANRFAWDVWGTRGSARAEPSGVIGPACLWVQR